MITCEQLGAKLEGYLHHRLALDGLVDWAEDAMQEEEFEEGHSQVIREVVSRLGLADVRAFGLTWEECEHLLEQLGYRAKIEISRVS